MPCKVTRCVMLADFSCGGVCVPTILSVLVVSTSSCRVAAVIFEESTEPCMALDGPLTLASQPRHLLDAGKMRVMAEIAPVLLDQRPRPFEPGQITRCLDRVR